MLVTAIVFGLVASVSASAASGPTLLPDVSHIDSNLTVEHNIDKFFSLWIVFNMGENNVSDKAFTILAPTNEASAAAEGLGAAAIRRLLLDHVVLGQRLDLALGADLAFTTLGGRTVSIRAKNGQLVANGARVLEQKVDIGRGRLIVLDNFLFPEDLVADRSFLQEMTEILSFLRSGVRVFQHLLARSNVTKLLKREEDYTVLVPTDRAFQRWHPIDWGFYPFSVPEFTETVLLNHFVPGDYRHDAILHGANLTTLGGKTIHFTRSEDGTLKANGYEVIKGDTPVTHGNILFLSEVLFVDDSTVHTLHESHKDKETPPLLAFPWFGAQFLSHAFLALETNSNFTHITRFLNVADLAPHVPGAGYTFFVPTDAAFERLGLDRYADTALSSGPGLEVLLSHFVRGRLYDRDIVDNTTLSSLANTTLHITRSPGELGTVEGARIQETEVFVYNLGTMFFVDRVIFGDKIPIPDSTESSTQPTTDGLTDSTVTWATDEGITTDPATEAFQETTVEPTTAEVP